MKAKPVRMKLGRDRDKGTRNWFWISAGSNPREQGICSEQFLRLFPHLKNIKPGQYNIPIEVTIQRVRPKKKARKRRKK